MKKCYNCGKELPDNAKFCVYCGQADERKGNSLKGNIVAWCLVGILAVAVVGIMIVAIKLNDKLFWEGYPSNKKYNYVHKQTVTQSQSRKETQTVKKDYSDKSTTLNFSLELPSCPATVNKYNWKNEISSTVRIDKIVAKYDKNFDGTYDITFNLTGEKIYGDEGYAYISYKLYDSENYIVDSGTFMIDKLSSGDKFKDMEETIYNLKSGTYRLEILDYR